MGIGGHILGPRKLRRLSALCGLGLDRAYIRNRSAEGVVWLSDEALDDKHYAIDPKTGDYELISEPWHWSTCYTHPKET